MLYVGFIFWISSRPRPVPGIELFPWIDKPYHLLEYTPLGSLWVRAIKRTFPWSPWRWIHPLSFLGCLAVGSLDEFYQSFIPEKDPSRWDVVWDVVGSALGQRFYQLKIHRHA